MSSDEQPEPDPVVVEFDANSDSGPTLTGSDLTVHLVREGGLAGVRAWMAAEDFRQQMKMVRTQAGTSREDVQRLKGGVLRMAEDAREQRT